MGKLDRIEAEQLKELERLGLKREVQHVKLKEPKLVPMHLRLRKVVERYYSHTTIVRLDDDSEEGLPLEACMDFAYCSTKDTFNKQIGRVIATARALDRYKRMVIVECADQKA